MITNARNILQVLSSRKYIAIAIVSTLLFFSAIIYFTKFDVMLGNLGILHTAAYSLLNGLVAILFGVYLALLIHGINKTKSLSLKKSGSGIIGAGSSVLVTGCVACSVTLASYLGLASVLTALPLYGLELNAAGVLLLSYSIKKLSDDKPKTCKVQHGQYKKS